MKEEIKSKMTTIRIPLEMRDKIADIATRNHRSIQQQALFMLEEKIKQEKSEWESSEQKKSG